MIRFSKIDDKLTVYKENQVILFGAGRSGKEIKMVLEHFGVHISFFCDNNPEKWGTAVKGITVLSPEQLKRVCTENTMIQITCTGSSEIEKQLKELGLNSYITYEEYLFRMGALCKYKNFQRGFEENFFEHVLYKRGNARPTRDVDLIDYAFSVLALDLDSYKILCLPAKTGDNTLMRSLRSAHQIVAVNCWHFLGDIPYEVWKLLGNKKRKIVTSVREIISQNLSLFFERTEDYSLMPAFWDAGGDVQQLFYRWIEHEFCLGEQQTSALEKSRLDFFLYDTQKGGVNILMQGFFEKNFEPYSHIDVFQYPFDKEKGYTIINVEEQNTEVFIYQLERLDDITDELGRFLGIEDFCLVNGNVGEEKWYADAYRQAKKEIKFPRAYFDFCFSNRVMTHFYSDADIEKFKQRWLPHVED